MDNIDLLYDHYKDTYALSKQFQGHRNKLFVYLCVLEALSFLFLIRPDTALEVFAAGINAHFDTGLVFGNVILQTLLDFDCVCHSEILPRNTLCREVVPVFGQLGKGNHARKQNKNF